MKNTKKPLMILTILAAALTVISFIGMIMGINGFARALESGIEPEFDFVMLITVCRFLVILFFFCTMAGVVFLAVSKKQPAVNADNIGQINANVGMQANGTFRPSPPPAVVAAVVCKQCGALNRNLNKFCGSCGAKLDL